jgi:hypothetical protein
MRRWIGVALVLLLAPIFIPTTVSAQDETCFEETGFCISGRIREYWQTNGGLGVLVCPSQLKQAKLLKTKRSRFNGSSVFDLNCIATKLRLTMSC